MASLAVGIVNFGMSIISLWIVNSFGRRRLLFVGLTGQICGLAIAAAPLLAPTASVSAAAGWVMVFGVLLFVVFFAFSSGPLAWVIISEVFPLGARGKGAGVATATNWLANYVVALVYPVGVGDQEGRNQQKRVGWSFVAFGGICFLSYFYFHIFVPETHKLSLEEIEEQFEAQRQHRKQRSIAALARRRRRGKKGVEAEEPPPVECLGAAPGGLVPAPGGVV